MQSVDATDFSSGSVIVDYDVFVYRVPGMTATTLENAVVASLVNVSHLVFQNLSVRIDTDQIIFAGE